MILQNISYNGGMGIWAIVNVSACIMLITFYLILNASGRDFSNKATIRFECLCITSACRWSYRIHLCSTNGWCCIGSIEDNTIIYAVCFASPKVSRFYIRDLCTDLMWIYESCCRRYPLPTRQASPVGPLAEADLKKRTVESIHNFIPWSLHVCESWWSNLLVVAY